MTIAIVPDFPAGGLLPLVSAPACLQARGADEARPRCVTICPSEALRVRGVDAARPGPAIDADRCRACGLCAAACPAGAFADPCAGELEAAVRQRVQRFGAVTFRCAARKPTVRPHTVVVPCIGAVGEGLLVAAAAWNAERIELDDRPCAGCDVRAGRALARLAARRARALLRRYGRAPALGLVTRLPRPKRDPAHLSRRGFLAGLTGLRRERPGPELPIPEEGTRAPRDRRLLRAALRALGAPATSAAPSARTGLFAVAVAGRAGTCDLCGACAALCPTAALEVVDYRDGAALALDAPLCSGCGLCIELCPRGALRFSDTVGLAPGRVALERAAWGRCEACGRPRSRARTTERERRDPGCAGPDRPDALRASSGGGLPSPLRGSVCQPAADYPSPPHARSARAETDRIGSSFPPGGLPRDDGLCGDCRSARALGVSLAAAAARGA